MPTTTRSCPRTASRSGADLATRSGAWATTCSSTRGWWRRSAAARPGRDRRRGVGRRLVGRSRHDRGDPRRRVEPERQSAVVVPDEGHRSGGQLLREGPMIVAADDADDRAGRRSRATPAARRRAGRPGRAAGLEESARSRVGEAALRSAPAPPASGAVRRRSTPGPEGGEHVEDLVRALGKRPHVQRVRDRDTIEPELARAAGRP